MSAVMAGAYRCDEMAPVGFNWKRR